MVTVNSSKLSSEDMNTKYGEFEKLIYHIQSKYKDKHFDGEQRRKLIDLFINDLSSVSLNYQKFKEHIGVNSTSTIIHDRKDNGIYYTDIYLAKKLASISIDNYIRIHGIDKLSAAKFLEPCNGVGIFTFAYLTESQKRLEMHFPDNWKEYFEKLMENVYVVDNDNDALILYKHLLKYFCQILNVNSNDKVLEANIWNKGLIFNVLENQVEWISFHNVKEHFKLDENFDICLTNPPYRKLKAELKQYYNKEEFEKAKIIFESIAKHLRGKEHHLHYSLEGTLNLYKLFTEDILVNYTKEEKSVVGLLIPYNILTDLQCSNLRNLILDKHKLTEVISFEENNHFFNDSTQGLCFILLETGGKTENVKFLNGIINHEHLKEMKYNSTPVDLISELTTSRAIIPLNKDEKNIIEKTLKHKSIQEYEEITVLRGELDVTLGKKYMIGENESIRKYPLLRGNALGSDYLIKQIEANEYINIEEFFKKSSGKEEYSKGIRIACQQIVNMKKSKRISFSLIPQKIILANSCNFMNVDKKFMSLYSLLGYMNSTFINWRFCLTSSNNHVNNYELKELPIPNPRKYRIAFSKINQYVRKYLSTNDELFLLKIDAEVFKMFSLNANEVMSILLQSKKSIDIISKVLLLTFGERKWPQKMKEDLRKLKFSSPITSDKESIHNEIVKKYEEMLQSKIFNHSEYKLSDLDIEMIKNVPPGGNWKNIPQEVVEKSQRLKTISEKGGRTTLYGRLKWDEPSYTVTTYFNRPGNGTYVYPEYSVNRVISPREAARLQSFPDSYKFYGNQRDILQQIGNAVPPLLAYNLGKKIKDKLGIDTAVDLFSGAGGMSEGFRQAGYQIKISNDFAEAACKTYKINHPETNVICGDITLEATKEKIYDAIDNTAIDIIFGGPPCQGFSHAGKRLIDDPRNLLFKEYVEIVSKVRPKLFIMENVDGLLTSNGGKTYQSILECFEEIGYIVEGRKLHAVEYGVPQKRKRVIIIGVRMDIHCLPSELFPEKVFSAEENSDLLSLLEEEKYVKGYTTVKEAFSTLPVEIDERLGYYCYDTIEPYALLMKELINYEQFIQLQSLKRGYPKSQ